MKNNILKNLSLRKKIIGSYLLFFIIPMLIISNVMYGLFAANINRLSSEFTQIYMAQISTTVNSHINSINNISKSIFNDNNLIKQLKRSDENISMTERLDTKINIEKFLFQIKTSAPELSEIILVGDNGTTYQYGFLPRVDYNLLSEQNWFKDIQTSNGELKVLNDANFFHPEINYIVIGRRIKDFDGEDAGIFLFIVNPKDIIKFSQIQTEVHNKYDIRIKMYDQDDKLMASLIPEELEEQIAQNGSEENKSKEVASIVQYNNTEYNFRIEVIYSNKLLQKEAEYIMRTNILVIVFCVIFSIILSAYLSYSITKPLIKLEKNMELVKQGEYKTIEENNGSDEISSLIRNYNLMVKKINKLFNNVYLVKIKEKKAQILALQHQINPHMLFNTLEVIRMEAAINKDMDVSNMIKTLAKMFRLALNSNSRNNFIHSEIDYAKAYVDLHNIRMNNIELDVDINQKIKRKKILPLVFQPVIENSIIHGFIDRRKKYKINIDAEFTSQNDILIKISDNGVGIGQEEADKINEKLFIAKPLDKREINSIGLFNIAERIRLNYGENYYIKISSKKNSGTTVEILIPSI